MHRPWTSWRWRRRWRRRRRARSAPWFSGGAAGHHPQAEHRGERAVVKEINPSTQAATNGVQIDHVLRELVEVEGSLLLLEEEQAGISATPCSTRRVG